jgi:hypothetical protein
MQEFVSKRDGSKVYVFQTTSQGGLCGRLEGCVFFARRPDAPKEEWSQFVASAFRQRFEPAQ